MFSRPSVRPPLTDAVRRVLAMPSIAQRTPEWYKARGDLITASACADALDENPYDKSARSKLLLSKVTGESNFVPNRFMAHGVRYEPLATLYYETLFGRSVYDMGLVVHPSYSYIGASPDGLSHDGRMLEIKCPLTRKLKKSGKICGDICPKHYWVQVQVQLEVCNMEVCDFWQCSFAEFACFEEWSAWQPEESNTNIVGRKGLLVLKKDGGVMYPPRIFDKEEEWLTWAGWVFAQEKVVDSMVFWKLDDFHNESISRDREWFSGEALPRLTKFWDDVLQSRQTPRKEPSFFD